MRNLSSTSFKHACKLSLVLLICASFVLQTNITKPLAETLTSLDSSSSLVDPPEEAGGSLEAADDPDQEMPPGVPETVSEDVSHSMNSESNLSAETFQSNALGSPFAWNPTTNVLTIQGDCKASDITSEIASEASSAQEVCFSGTVTITTDQNSSSPFSGATNLERISALDTTHVSFAAAAGAANPTLDYFFRYCSNLTSIDGLAAWEVSNVSGERCMEAMFYGCSNLNSLDALTSWNVSNVTGDFCMHSMFQGCSSLTSLDALTSWNVSNVTRSHCMDYMFFGCSNLSSLDGLASWNVSSVKGIGCMQYMFYGCSELTSLDALASWNLSNVTGDYCLFSMFSGCTNLQDITGLASWNLTKAKAYISGVNNMLSGCTSITHIKGASTDASGFVPTSAMSIPTLVSANNFYSEQAPTTPVPGNTLLANWSTYAPQGTWTWKQIVTFDANGGQRAPAQELVAHNAYATKPTPEQNPTRVGYTFVNWYTDETGTILFDFSAPILTDTVVYAKWKTSVLTAIFDLNGGEGMPPAAITLSYGEVFPTDEKPADPTRTGYSFAGWYTEATEGSKVEWGTTTVTQTADFVLYAHWIAGPSPSGDILPEQGLLPQTGDVSLVLLPLLLIPAALGLFVGYAVLKRNER